MNYPADHPFAMFNTDRPGRTEQQPAMRTARGYVTNSAVMLALRSLGRATPTQIGNELREPAGQVSRQLYALWRQGEVKRQAVRAQSPIGFRSTYEYWIEKKEILQ